MLNRVQAGKRFTATEKSLVTASSGSRGGLMEPEGLQATSPHEHRDRRGYNVNTRL